MGAAEMPEYGTSVESKATPEKVWKIWSDMTTWGDWNPNVSTMDWQGGFQSGTTGVMNTRAGQHHNMKLLDVNPGRSFALETAVVPLTYFRFNCRIGSAGGKKAVGPGVGVKGPVGPGNGGNLGPPGSQ